MSDVTLDNFIILIIIFGYMHTRFYRVKSTT